MASRFGAIVPLLVLMLLACVSVFLGTSSGNLLIPLAITYAVAFMVLTWHRFDVSLGLVLVLAPWIQDVSGGEGVAKFSVAELHILLVAVVHVAKSFLRRSAIDAGILTGPVLLYVGLMAVSSYQGGIEREDVISLFQTAIFCFVLPALYRDRTLTSSSARALLLLAACSTVALAVIQVVAGPRAFAVGIHKNNMGMGLAAGLSIWLCAWFDPTRAWWSKYVVAAVGIVTVGLVFTLSRGAWVGASCALVSLAIMYGRLQLLFRTGLVIVPLVAIMWNYLPKEDRQYAASFERKHLNNIDTRYNNFDRSYALIEKSPLIGNGVSIRKQLDATNLVMATLAEGGVVGFVLFLIPFGVYFALVSRLVRVLPRSDPKFFIVAASCALMVSRLGHAQFDHYWVRGASTIAWASVGMVLAVGQTTSLTRRHSAMVLVDSKKRERLFN